MANITVLNASDAVTKTISVSMGASMVIQDQTGNLDYYVTLSTTTRDSNNVVIPTFTIKKLTDGAGQYTGSDSTRDRKGNLLTGPVIGGAVSYPTLTAAINDYVAMISQRMSF
jgi:hypothetical protein